MLEVFLQILYKMSVFDVKNMKWYRCDFITLHNLAPYFLTVFLCYLYQLLLFSAHQNMLTEWNIFHNTVICFLQNTHKNIQLLNHEGDVWCTFCQGIVWLMSGVHFVRA